MSYSKYTKARFTKNFFIVGKYFAPTQIPIKQSLQNFAHHTAAQQSCDVQKFVAICGLRTESQQLIFSGKFEFLVKNH